eukprot:TRINITY_DN2038_c0_g1_i1.p1 TRINITY_DN2038_c0_g1~~TRINITY_DN2038_c0_g1_i1.p1  ORF type:complete len:1760 (-),score=518.87 TRINITY_DN2038_c0_g1_i1:119-5398(-)
MRIHPSLFITIVLLLFLSKLSDAQICSVKTSDFGGNLTLAYQNASKCQSEISIEVDSSVENSQLVELEGNQRNIYLFSSSSGNVTGTSLILSGFSTIRISGLNFTMGSSIGVSNFSSFVVSRSKFAFNSADSFLVSNSSGYVLLFTVSFENNLGPMKLLECVSLIEVSSFVNNSAGALFATGDTLQVTDSLFYGNVNPLDPFANEFGGIYYIPTTLSNSFYVGGSSFIYNGAARGAAIRYYVGNVSEPAPNDNDRGDITINDSIFISNTAFEGGAINVDSNKVDRNVSPYFYNCTFYGNYAGGSGTIRIEEMVEGVTVDSSNFTANHAEFGGGGIYVTFVGLLAVIDTSFTSNSAVIYGGAIVVAGGANTVLLQGTYFTKNNAGAGGCIRSNSRILVQKTNIFEFNSATETGGAIESHGQLEGSGAVFRSNYAVLGGGAIAAEDWISAKNFTFIKNSSENGGGVSITFLPNRRANPVFNNCTFQDNSAKNLGGAVHSKIPSNFYGSTFVGNSAFRGGAFAFVPISNTLFYLEDLNCTKNIATDEGGSVYMVNGTARLLRTLTMYNRAPLGGGFSLSGANISLYDLKCLGNTATTAGGGCLSHNGGSLNLNGTIEKNSGIDGGGVYIKDCANVSIFSTTFAANSALKNGGGLAVEITQETGGFRLRNCTFQGDSSSNGGSISVVSSSGSLLHFSSLKISESFASLYGGGVYLEGGGSFIISNISIISSRSLNGGSVASIGANQSLSINSMSSQSTSADNSGGSIYLSKSVEFSLSNSIITNSKAVTGGAIFVDGDSNKITLSTTSVENVRADVQGGAIQLVGTLREFVLSSFSLNNCSAPIQGGGISITGNVENFRGDSVFFHRNTAILYGGSMFVSGKVDYLTLEGGIIDSNDAVYGGSFYLADSSTKISIGGLQFSNNSAGNRGGSIFARGIASFHAERSNFTLNTAMVSGGAVHLEGVLESVTITNSSISYNSALQGGAFNLEGGSDKFFVIGSDIFANRATSVTGEAFSLNGRFNQTSFINCNLESNRSPHGGAIFIQFDSSSNYLTVDNSSFVDNTATALYGGALSSVGDCENLNIYGSKFINNTAPILGGAIALSGKIENLTLVNSHLLQNQVNGQGGAISVQQSGHVQLFTVESSELSGNSGSTGSATSALDNVDKLVVKLSRFEDNRADDEGAAISIKNPEEVSVYSSLFFENRAGSNGGAIVMQGQSNSRVYVNDSSFILNTAKNGAGIYIKGEADKKRAEGPLVSIFASVFSLNEALESGGGMFMDTNEAIISSSNITDNRASVGSGVQFLNGTVTLDSFNTISNGSFYLSDESSLRVDNNSTLLSFLSCNAGKIPQLDVSLSVSCQNFTEVPTSLTTIDRSTGDNVVVIKEQTSQSILPIIIGVSVGGGVLILVIVLILVLFLRARRERRLRRRNAFSMIDFSKINLGEAKNSVVDYDEFKNPTEIGSGAFGVVYVAEWRELKVAIKQIKSENVTSDQLNEFLREVGILKGLRAHPNVIMFLGITFPPQPLSLITEFAEKGGLYDYLRRHTVSDEMKMSFIHGIAKGMLHLHLEKVIHRDMAARNVLLNRFLEPKVSDFGLSRETQSIESGATTATTVGPLKWMSPEAILKREYSNKSDVWSFGVVIWEILTVSDPFPECSAVEAAILVSHQRQHLPIPTNAPPKLAQLMSDCWKFLPEERPDFSQICATLDPSSHRISLAPFDREASYQNSDFVPRGESSNYSNLNPTEAEREEPSIMSKVIHNESVY